MEATFLAGAITFAGAAAGGAFGLVLARGKNKQQPAPAVQPMNIEKAIERAMARKPEWEAQLEAALAKPMQLEPLSVQVPEPDWHKKELQVSAVVEPQSELRKIVAATDRTNTLFEAFLARLPETDKRLEGIARLVAKGLEPLDDLPSTLAQLMTQTGSNVTITQPPMLLVGGGGNGGGGGTPPRRSTPRAVPRANPGPPMPTPSIPAGYVGGSVTVPAGEPVSLLALIQQQLTPNCPGSSMELLLSADDSVMVGSASTLGGPLSDTNYAYELVPGDPPRLYRSSFPGHCTPLGDLQVFSTGGATLHVEVS